ncbi:MAG TPA: 30S ribosomal protein S1 [Pseudogracilibacillus sp.]|nr:30S ribosomal protein S1 [Pseudogracilibacillus sp.]
MVESNNELQVGNIITGKVVKIEEKQVFVDIDYKSEGIIPISELSNLHVENAGDVVEEGEELELMIKKIEGEEDERVILSKKMVDAEAAWEDLQAKFESGEVFDTVVKEIVKGGLVVDVGLRGFIPASLVETYFVEDFAEYQDKTLSVKVVDLDKEQNRVILSHRAVAEEEQSKEKAALLQSLEAGQVVDGTVQRITDFGAFVDIGGVDGLVHISELAHTHVAKVTDVLSEGQEIKVEVLSVDEENERISLSYKNTLPGPWEGVEERIKEGDIVEGTVKRIVDFGAFVEIEAGVEGLVHISQIANRHIGTPDEVLDIDQKIEAKVLSVSEEEERISLSIKEVASDDEPEEEVIETYEPEEESSGFSIGDMIGDDLDKYK